MKLSLLSVASLAGLVAGGPTTQECESEDTVLQFLHIQDVSYSAMDNKEALIPQINQLTNDLRELFHRRETGLASFSDKGIRPHGDPNGDYCYRQNRVFRDSGYKTALENLPEMSGLDWRESQLEAVLRALESTQLGWLPDVDPDTGRDVMRVIMLVTDAMPHQRGVFPNKPVDTTKGCLGTDYPSVADVKAALELTETTFIILTTNELVRSWTELVADIDEAIVVPQDDFSEVADRIEEILCDRNGRPPLIGCGADSQAVKGSALDTCAVVCGHAPCSEIDTERINESDSQCKVVVEALFPGQVPLPEISDRRGDWAPYGCGVNDVAVFEWNRKPAIGDLPSGCDAGPATEGANQERICCCVNAP